MEDKAISKRMVNLINEVGALPREGEFRWLAAEVRELERQLEETTTIVRMKHGLSKAMMDTLEQTLSAITKTNLHKREFAWFLYQDDSEAPETDSLVTITIGADSLRFRSQNERTELSISELDNFVLKGHRSKVEKRIHNALSSVGANFQTTVN